MGALNKEFSMATESSKPQGRPQSRRHVFEGVVVSDKADKTRVVVVGRRVREAHYEKVVRRRSKFYVHDEKNESHVGDMVEIMGSRPLSKLKRWRLVRILKAASRMGGAEIALKEGPA
jgi:small subunit ribosomal protein S17